MGALDCVCVLIVLAVILAAAELSCDNVPDFNGNFLVASYLLLIISSSNSFNFLQEMQLLSNATSHSSVQCEAQYPHYSSKVGL